MVRRASAVLLLCASSAPTAGSEAAAEDGDDVTVLEEISGVDQLTVDMALEIGVLSKTHATLTAGYARRLWGERLYVEGRLGIGTTTDVGLVVLEVRGGAGFVFRPGERTEIMVGWRVGDTYLNGNLPGEDGFFSIQIPYRIHLLALELAIAFQIRIDERWRLRALPLAPTLFWNGTYGGTFGLELGVARAF